MAATGLCKYELQRLEHIRRNQEFIASLNIPNSSDIAPKRTPAPRKRRAAQPLPVPETLRRSSRVTNTKPEYTGETIGAPPEGSLRWVQIGSGTSWTRAWIQSRPSARRPPRPSCRRCGPANAAGSRGQGEEEMDYEALQDEIRQASMDLLTQARGQLLPLVTIQDEAKAEEDDWRAEAVQRWGPHAGALKKGEPARDWKLFVQSRLSHPPPVSPIDFLQEYYAADVWRLLSACIMMSRVSSWDTKHNCISAFFKKYPNPSAFLDETDWSAVKQLINPLGLFDDRLRSLTALTAHFLAKDEFGIDPSPKSPNKVHGVGPFGYESYLVFCKDQGPSITLSQGGKPIQPFVTWRKQFEKKRAKPEP